MSDRHIKGGGATARTPGRSHSSLNLVTDPTKRLRLGEVLVRSGVITADQLQHALEQQKKLRLPVGQLLVRLNYLTDEAMRQALSVQLNVAFLDLDRVTIDPAL